MFQLYTFDASPNALKVRFALAELGISYDPIEVDLLSGEQNRDGFGALNPHRKVPVLVEGDFVMRESDAIIAYLGFRFGGALWPTQPRVRGEALQWLFFDAANFAYAGRIWWADVITPKTGRRGPNADPALVAAVTEDVSRALFVLDEHLSSRTYLLGRDFTLADCGLGVTVNLLKGTRLDQPDFFPAVTAYRDRIRSRPGWVGAFGAAIHAFL